MSAIVLEHMRKSYGSRVAVKDLSLTVQEGQVYALLGPNGAGKTTTIEILEGFRDRSDGSAKVLGVDPRKADSRWRARIGVVFQDQAVEPYLSVVETLQLFSLLYPTHYDIDELLELAGLTEARNQKAHSLSGGQKRRLDLALALIGNPDLIFLDEPTTGFDPAARRQAWDTVRRLCRLGKTVLLTTHYMDEAQHLADNVGILVNGELVLEGTPDDLTGLQPVATVRFHVPPDIDLSSAPAELKVDGDEVSVQTSLATKTLNELTSWALARGVELPGLTVTRPSLEDIYLQVVKSK